MTFVTEAERPALGTADSSTARPRLLSIDVVRGAVMVLMALDHVRWFTSDFRFEPTNLSKTTIALFFTRWVTHFCAPAFVFLAGTGAFLHGRKLASRGALSRFLVVRGLWLIVVEMTIVRLGWTFNVDYAHYVLGGVIWMIGWCLVGLGALVWLPLPAIAAIGLAIVGGHDALAPVARSIASSFQGSAVGGILQIVYVGGPVKLGGGPVLVVLFSIVPCIGVAALGYALGRVMTWAPDRRRRFCLAVGLGATALFVLLRAVNRYGDPRPWGAQATPASTVLSFLNTSKYPASLLFLLMTLGPTIAVLPLLERARGRVVDALATFGRVPFLYYVLHIPLIHVVAITLSVARFGHAIPWLTTNQPAGAPPPPPDWGWSLPVVYLLTAFVVAMLYLPCRWFAALKSRRREAWLSFL